MQEREQEPPEYLKTQGTRVGRMWGRQSGGHLVSVPAECVLGLIIFFKAFSKFLWNIEKVIGYNQNCIDFLTEYNQIRTS